MGNNKLRRYINHCNKWTDKEAIKHKHDFSIECLVRLDSKSGYPFYYKALKCKYCNSFKDAKFIADSIECKSILVFQKAHGAIGFRDLTFLRYVQKE